MTAEKPLGMLGEGGDSGERLMRLPVGERRAGEKALLRQSDGLKDVQHQVFLLFQ